MQCIISTTPYSTIVIYFIYIPVIYMLQVNKDLFDAVSQSAAGNVARIRAANNSQGGVLSVASQHQLLLLEYHDGRNNVVLRAK